MHINKNISLLFLSLCIGFLIACGETHKRQPVAAKEAAPVPTPAPEHMEVKISGQDDVAAEKLSLLKTIQAAPGSGKSLPGFASSSKRMAAGESEFFNLKVVVSTDGKFQMEIRRTRCKSQVFNFTCHRKMKITVSGTWEYSNQRILLIDQERFVVLEIDAEQRKSNVEIEGSVAKLELLDEGLPRHLKLSLNSGATADHAPSKERSK